MLTALGVTPNASNKARAALNYDVYPYIEKYVDKDSITFGTFTESSGSPIPQSLSDVETNSIVLSEWAKAKEDEYKYSNVVTNVMYTSMADTTNARYLYTDTSKDSPNNIEMGTDASVATPWHKYVNGGLWSYRKGLMMLAQDLDKYYNLDNVSLQGNTNLGYSTYQERANYIIENDIATIKDLKQQYSQVSSLIGNIGFFSGQTDSTYQSAASNKITQIFDPFVYPELYSPIDGIGMGASFPTPNTTSGTNIIKWADDGGSLFAVRAQDPSTLVEAFQNKFNKIVFVKSPKISKEDLLIQINNLKDFLPNDDSNKVAITIDENINIDNESLIKTSNPNIVIINWLDWYPPTWGALGKKIVLQQIVNSINALLENQKKTTNKLTYDINSGWKTYLPNELVKPTKK